MKKITGTPTTIRLARRTSIEADGTEQELTAMVTTVSTAQGFTAHFQIYRTGTHTTDSYITRYTYRTGYVNGTQYDAEREAIAAFDEWTQEARK